MAEAEHIFADIPEAVGWNRLRRPVWLFDDSVKRHLYANAAALQLWGAETLEEFLDRDCSDQSPAAQARCAQLFEKTAAGDTVVERWTFYPNGVPMTVQALISTHHMPDGHAVLMFEAQEERVGDDQLRSLEALRHSPCIIAMVDRHGHRVFRNPAAFATFDTDEVSAEGRYVNAGAGQSLFDAAWSGAPSSALLLARTKTGERWLHTVARKVSDPATGEDCLLLNSQDVTAQIEAEQALAVAAERAELAEQRERFLTTVSHDMRTPLNCILGFTELMLKDTTDHGHRDALGRVAEAGRSLVTLVNEMLSEIGPDNGAHQARQAVSTTHSRAARILYADDHENNRLIVRAMLTQLGCDCDVAEDGAQAVEMVRLGDYDLVLMDVQMPVMDGMEATRAIRALPDYRAHAPIIALTANTLERQVKRYIAAGMNDCLAKPAGAVDLAGKIASWTGEGWRKQRALLTR